MEEIAEPMSVTIQRRFYELLKDMGLSASKANEIVNEANYSLHPWSWLVFVAECNHHIPVLGLKNCEMLAILDHAEKWVDRTQITEYIREKARLSAKADWGNS